MPSPKFSEKNKGMKKSNKMDFKAKFLLHIRLLIGALTTHGFASLGFTLRFSIVKKRGYSRDASTPKKKDNCVNFETLSEMI